MTLSFEQPEDLDIYLNDFGIDVEIVGSEDSIQAIFDNGTIDNDGVITNQAILLIKSIDYEKVCDKCLKINNISYSTDAEPINDGSGFLTLFLQRAWRG